MAVKFLIFFLALLGALGLSHYFVFRTVIFVFRLQKPVLVRALKFYFILAPLFFILMELLSFRYYNLLTRFFYIISTILMGLFYFFFFFAIVFWICYLLFKLTGFSSSNQAIGLVLASLASIATIISLITPWLIRTHEITVTLPGLPHQWRGKKAVWISDLHLGQVWGKGTAQKIANMIDAQAPDMLFIGGDLYDGTPLDIDYITAPFSKLAPPLGKYFITGNHEEFRDRKVYYQAVEKVGFKVLNNSKADIDGLQLIGVDYADSRADEKFESTLKSMWIRADQPAVLLKHLPNQLEIAERNNIDLQISGHTHGGQLFPINFITSWVFGGYHYGLNKYGSMQTYTSSGVGTWGPPMRFLAPAEIVIIRFK